MSSSDLTPLFVVILNWNLAVDTIACIESLQPRLPADAHILVVDNGSSDDSVEVLQSRFGEQTTVVANERNLGFAAGMNVGIRRAVGAGAQSVLVLNNDTVAAPDMLAELLQAMSAGPHVGAVGPVIYYHAAPDRIWRVGDRAVPCLPVPLRLGRREVERAGGKPLPVDYLTACALLVRREVFDQVGLFDESYPMYYEDADFCRRVRRAGWQTLAVPRARLWHKVALSASRQKRVTRYTLAWGRSRFYLGQLHGPQRLPALAFLLWKGLVTTARDIAGRDWALIRPLWRGTLDGARGRVCDPRMCLVNAKRHPD